MLAKNFEGGIFKSSFKNHIHISGWARSGTTLIKNMFHCFNEVIVTPAETLPDLSMHFQGSSDYRDKLLSEKQKYIITKQPGSGLNIIKKYPDLNMIWMIRDPRDLLCSINPTNPSKAWHIDHIQAFANYFELIDSIKENFFMIKYEDLILNSNLIQQQLEKEFTLTSKALFSEWHLLNFQEEEIYIRGMRGIRPVTSKHIGQWKNSKYYQQIKDFVDKYPKLQDELKKYGYEK